LTDLRLIVGLGNPGKDYEYTRHNLGFLVVEQLAARYQLKFKSSTWCKGLTAEGLIENKECCLLLPLTYMNNSGVAVKETVSRKEVSLIQTLVVADDFNLDFGQLRLREKGSAGGHNGLKSVIQYLASEEFARLRLGIGCPPNKKDITDYVLEKFRPQEKKELNSFIQDAVECGVAWVNGNSNQVMSQFNRKKST
jgi:peptidyl-tRNA hydrolase, PTH1 family